MNEIYIKNAFSSEKIQFLMHILNLFVFLAIHLIHSQSNIHDFEKEETNDKCNKDCF